jgi:hypothetical protein
LTCLLNPRVESVILLILSEKFFHLVTASQFLPEPSLPLALNDLSFNAVDYPERH